MTKFICPVCKSPLEKNASLYSCFQGHSFDRASSGYVNLLSAKKQSSKISGDGKEMVSARQDFLEKDYYLPLKEALVKTADLLASGRPINYLDAGCGTGYYTKGVVDALLTESALCVDVSKFACKACAKKVLDADVAVASVYDLPVSENSIDLITCVFSPMADREYLRVMKKGAYLLYVVPAPKHLYSLKEHIYEAPYENEEQTVNYEGFVQRNKIPVSFELDISCTEDIMSLFAMTPYFWRSPQNALEKIRALDFLKTRAEFYILVLEKL